MAIPEENHSIESVTEETLFQLANFEVNSPSQFREAIRLLCEKASAIFKCDKVGLWVLNEQNNIITAENIFESVNYTHSSGTQIEISDYPLFIQILSKVRAHSISKIDKSNVPSKKLYEYFRKFDVRSVLSSGIFHKGKIVGVLSGSTIGKYHSWSFHEKLLFASLGDILSKWMLETVSPSIENSSHAISLRKIVKEASILCSNAGTIGFKEATQNSLISINNIVKAYQTRAIIIEKRGCYILSSQTNNVEKIPTHLAKRVFKLCNQSSITWVSEVSKSKQHIIPLLKQIGFKEGSAILLTTFGTSNIKDFNNEHTNTYGILCIEFSTPIPSWNETFEEIILCASESFSILTQHAQTNTLYKESLNVARAAFQYSSVGMALFDSIGKIIKVNRAFTKLLDSNEVIFPGTSIWKVAPRLIDHFLHLETIKKSDKECSYQFEEEIKCNSEKKWGLFNISWIPEHQEHLNKDNGYFFLQALNITERKNALLKLTKQRTFFRSVIDTDPNFIFAKDKEGRFTLANRSVADAYGTTVDNIIGKTDSDFNYNKKQVESFLLDDQFVLNQGKTLNKLEEVITDAKGNVRYLQTVKSPIYDEEGNPKYVLGVSTDITERKKLEEKRRELLIKLEHTQKLESLGVLASGIAHDFNNLLLGIIGNASLALSHIKEDNPAYSFIEKSLHAAEHASDLTSQLLSYSGKDLFHMRPVELTTSVRETCILIERIIEKKGVIIFNVNKGDIIVDADISKLRQVILNIITNAADAIESGKGEINIKTYTQHLKSPPIDCIKEESNFIQGIYGVLEVQDNGCGMTEEVKKNIFDPFFTTKTKGRGLGLASVLGIISSHKGLLCLNSIPEKGSTFRVYLPISESKNLPRENLKIENSKIVSCKNRNNTILLIDDDSIPREVCTYMLESFGYTVITAKNGEEGIQFFKSHYNNLLSVILDWNMPKLDGSEVYKIIRSISSNTPILITSGHDKSKFVKELSSDNNVNFIQKPFTPDTLNQLISTYKNTIE